MGWKFLDSSGRLKELAQQFGINPTHQVFTTAGSGTYITPTGVTEILVECLGGGGTGGQAQTGSNATYAAGSGGNGGNYAASLITNPAASYSYTVGAGGAAIAGGGTLTSHAGGDTSFGSSLVLAKGGAGGVQDGQAGHTGYSATFATGPQSGDIGDIVMKGFLGEPGQLLPGGTLAIGGKGGMPGGPYASAYPAQQVFATGNTSAAGNSVGPNAYGCGSSGSVAGQFSGGAIAVAAGGNGLIIVTEFYGVRSIGGAKTGINFTTQDFALGPPSNPLNGDIWYATNVNADGSGTVWQFRYNAGSASAFKWEFVGGPAIQIVVDTFETTTSAWPTVVDLTTVGPSFTPVRAGDYEYVFSVRANNNTAGISTVALVTYVTGGVTTNDSVQAVTTSSTANADEMGMEQGRITVDANTAIKLRYSTLSSGTARFGQRRLWVTPVRIS